MNYLENNLNNSKALPYDIMKLISDYVKPLFLKQIENKDYDLDDIMYKKMKKKINENPMYYRDFIGMDNKDVVIHLYKNCFLQEYENKKICGLYCCNLSCIDYKKYLMILDLRYAKIYKPTNTNYDKYKLKNVYKKWLKL